MDLRIVAAEQFGVASADAFLALLDGFDRPIVGLPTGNTPVPMYDELARRVAAGQCDLSTVRPFAIDEYGGPLSNPCSNRRFFVRHWETIPGVARVAGFRPSEANLPAEAARVARLLSEAGGLDLVVLGIGTNGHVAFNEPGTPRDAAAHVATLTPETRLRSRACWGDAVPFFGLTLGLKELMAARRVLLLANGTRKAAIVAAALQGQIGPSLPASFFQDHPGLTVVLDEDAAGGLR